MVLDVEYSQRLLRLNGTTSWIGRSRMLGEPVIPTNGANANRPFIGDGSTPGGRALACLSDVGGAQGMPRGYISGFTLANNAADAPNDIDVAAGAGGDDANGSDLT